MNRTLVQRIKVWLGESKAKFLHRFGSNRTFISLRSKPKVFILGRNKTGTSTMKWLLYGHGYIMAEQYDTMPYLHDLANGRYDRIVEHGKLAEGFQDAPYSFADIGLLKALTNAYPNAKYILTVRKSPDVWWKSFEKWYYQFWNLPNREKTTWEELESVPTVSWFNQTHLPSILQEMVIPKKDDLPYDKRRNVENYLKHNKMVEDFFALHPQYQFFKLCLGEDDTMKKLSNFLGFKVKYLPHANKNR